MKISFKMKTRRPRSRRDGPKANQRPQTEARIPIYVSTFVHGEFGKLIKSSGLSTDQLLRRLIDGYNANLAKQEDPGTAADQDSPSYVTPMTPQLKGEMGLSVCLDTTQDDNQPQQKEQKLHQQRPVGGFKPITKASKKTTVRSKLPSHNTTGSLRSPPARLERLNGEVQTTSDKPIPPTQGCNTHKTGSKQELSIEAEPDATVYSSPGGLTDDVDNNINSSSMPLLENETTEPHDQSQIALVLLSMSQVSTAESKRHTCIPTGDGTLTSPNKTCLAPKEPLSKTGAVMAEKRTTGKVFDCDQCSYQTKKRGDLKTHMRVHTGARPYSCKQCGASFRQQHHLRYHELTHSDSFSHQCPACQKSFRTISKLRVHMKTHSEIVPDPAALLAKERKKEVDFQCDQCSYKAPTASDLRKHANSHATEKHFRCEFCDFATSWKKNLRVHRMRHTGEAPYACVSCPYATHDSHALKRHRVKVHTAHEQATYMCEVCGAGFTQRKLLAQHQVVHTGEKPHKCPHCDYSARYRSNLRTHLLMHEPKKGFVCEDCGKAFRQKQHLSGHRKNKHTDPNKVYLCQICGFSTRASQSFNSHMRIHSGSKANLSKAKDVEDNSSQIRVTSPSAIAPANALTPTDNQVQSPDLVAVENFVKEHNYSALHDKQEEASAPALEYSTSVDGLTPAQAALLALETTGTSQSSPTDTTPNLFHEMVGESATSCDTSIIQGNAVLSVSLPGSVTVLAHEAPSNPHQDNNSSPVPDDVLGYTDQPDNQLYQYEGVAAVLNHIMPPEFNYQT